MKKKYISIISCILLLCLLIISIILFNKNSSKGSVTYRETAVAYGPLVVGITEGGSVDIGTINQIFELVLRALQRISTSNTINSPSNNMLVMGGNGNAGMSSGLDMFSQIFDMANNSNRTNTTETDSNIIVSSVEVSIGQQVEVGDILYFLEETGVSELAEELESNVMKAKADLDALIADQNLSKSTADYTYQTSLAYGEYAKEEYQSTISQLQLTVTEKENALEKAKTSLLRYEEQLSQANTDYQNAYQIQLNCEWSRDNTNKNDSTYLYVTYFQEAMSAKATADSLAQKIEQLENTITQAKANVEISTTELAKAKRSLEAGILSATQTLSLRKLAYDTAQETLDIALSYLTEDLISQAEIYQKAADKCN